MHPEKGEVFRCPRCYSWHGVESFDFSRSPVSFPVDTKDPEMFCPTCSKIKKADDAWVAELME